MTRYYQAAFYFVLCFPVDKESVGLRYEERMTLLVRQWLKSAANSDGLALF